MKINSRLRAAEHAAKWLGPVAAPGSVIARIEELTALFLGHPPALTHEIEAGILAAVGWPLDGRVPRPRTGRPVTNDPVAFARGLLAGAFGPDDIDPSHPVLRLVLDDPGHSGAGPDLASEAAHASGTPGSTGSGRRRA